MNHAYWELMRDACWIWKALTAEKAHSFFESIANPFGLVYAIAFNKLWKRDIDKPLICIVE
jgi:hypothetical protein